MRSMSSPLRSRPALSKSDLSFSVEDRADDVVESPMNGDGGTQETSQCELYVGVVLVGGVPLLYPIPMGVPFSLVLETARRVPKLS